MVERRLLGGRLFLSCHHGLVELDLTDLPRVHELDRLPLDGGHAVVARMSAGAFAISRGIPREWGFETLRPATLVGVEDCSLFALGRVLREEPVA